MAKNSREDGQSFSEWVLLNPFFGAVTALTGAVAGVLASHDHESIWAAGWPWTWSNLGGIPWEALKFWLTVVAFGVFLAGTLWAQARSSKRATDGINAATGAVSGKADVLMANAANLDGKVEVLDDLIRQLHTLPPKGFLRDYGKAVNMAAEAFFRAESLDVAGDPADEIEALETAIRTQLALVMNLAAGFDADSADAAYGCNIMVFLPTSVVSADKKQELDGRLKFVDNGVNMTGLKGALDLVKALSVSTASPAGPDPALPEFALPVVKLAPDAVPEEGAESVLAGAPLAFLRRTAAFVEDSNDWEGKSDHLCQKAKRELEEFFKSQKGAIRSFVAIPLYAEPVTEDAPATDPIGVLNIHRNTPNPSLSEKMQMLSPLLAPITVLTGRLLSDYLRKNATLLTQ